MEKKAERSATSADSLLRRYGQGCDYASLGGSMQGCLCMPKPFLEGGVYTEVVPNLMDKGPAVKANLKCVSSFRDAYPGADAKSRL